MLFVYIFILIVLAFVIFFGAKTIHNVVSVGETVDYESFVINLKNEFSNLMALDFGSSVSLAEINVPRRISEVCFVDTRSSVRVSSVQNEQLKDLIGSGVRNSNVFFANDEILDEKFDQTFMLNENPLCDSTKDGKIDLMITNQGFEVEISRL